MMTTTGIDAFAPASTMLKALRQRQVSSEDLTPIRFAALAAQEIGGYARPPGYDE
jgi:hypothetical protein